MASDCSKRPKGLTAVPAFRARDSRNLFPCENKAMFTGIITAVGRISDLSPLGNSAQHGTRVRIACPPGYLSDVVLGDSIAINGACMTVTAFDVSGTQSADSAPSACFSVDVSAESLNKTCGLNAPGPVNLEKALRAGDRLGGHIVSGHVDGVGQVARFSRVGESWELCVTVPQALARFMAYKGSIAINGVSLTVNTVVDAVGPGAGTCDVSINLIPHTIEHTALGSLQSGSAVNLEVDTVARYVERMLGFSTMPQVLRRTAPEAEPA